MGGYANRDLVINSMITWARNMSCTDSNSPQIVISDRNPGSARLIRCPGHPNPIQLRIGGKPFSDCDIVATEMCASIELRPYHVHSWLSVFQPIVLTFQTDLDWQAFEEDSFAMKPPANPLLILSAIENSSRATNQMKKYAKYFKEFQAATIERALSIAAQ